MSTTRGATGVRALAALVVASVLAGCGSGDDEPSDAPVADAPASTAGASPSPTQSPTPSQSPAAGGELATEPETIASGLQAPWSIAFLPGADGSSTPLVSLRDSGDVIEVADDGSTRVVGTVADVVHEGESGLLGLAVDGERRLYAYSTGPDGNRIERYALEGEPGSLSLGAARTLLDGIPAASYHDGGRLALGPDGMLYAGVGDAGNAGAAQDVDELGGKILRMAPDGEVPADNPIPDSLVYSYGHRNVQGLAWGADGTMYASEFGQDTWDELNVIVPGANYGWPEVEGIAGDEDYTDPVQQWEPDTASPSGITTRGDSIYVANLAGRLLRSVPVGDLSSAEELLASQDSRLRDVVTAPDGSVWLLTSNTDGRGDPGADDDRILRLPPV